MAINWNDKNLIQSAVSKSKSRTQTLTELGYFPGASISRRKLNDAIVRFKINTDHFTLVPERWRDLHNIIKTCYSVGDVLKAVGLQDQGDNYKTAKRHINGQGVDTSHFNAIGGAAISPYTHEEIFCENSSVLRSVARRRVLCDNLLEYTCQGIGCGIEEWLGKKLVLDLDHINGINNDHRLKNLRFLCPNCHSLTETHRGKNR